MGNYINPPNMTKEKFLFTYGEQILINVFIQSSFSELAEKDLMAVILVDNGSFTAALICYDEREYNNMKECILRDNRPMVFFTVPKKELEPFI